MQLTQQIKINPSIAQQVILETLSERCRLIYNFALKERRDAFENNKRINYLKQQNDLPEIKRKYPEYKQVYSKVLQYALRTLDADYKSFFALRKNGNKTAKPPGFKPRGNFSVMVYNQSGFKIEKGFVELSHKHPTKTRLLFKIPKKFNFPKVYQVVVCKKDGEFYLSIIYENPGKNYKDNRIYQAFDLGVTKHTAVNSKGKFVDFRNERPDKYWEKPISELQSRRDHCKKDSSKRTKLHTLLKKCKRKSSNQLKDFQHKLSRKIVDNTKANTIIIGALPVKALCVKNRHKKGLHASMHNTGNISRFVRFLTYKAELAGKRTVKISERDTTKTCCICGKKHEMPLWERKYVCDCGNEMDRDRNSAVNIMFRFLSQNALWTGYRRFVGNLRHAANRKTRVSLNGLGGLAGSPALWRGRSSLSLACWHA